MKIYFANGKLRQFDQEGSFVHITELMGRLEEKGHDILLGSEYVPIGRSISRNRWIRFGQAITADILYYRFQGFPVPHWDRVFSIRDRLGLTKPVIWEVNATPELQERGPEYDSRLKAIEAQAKQVDWAICNTPALAQYCRELGIENTTVIPLGADTERFRPAPDRANSNGIKLKCLWMGNPDVPWHDLETIWNAAREIERKELNIEIHIAVPDAAKIDPKPPKSVTISEGISHHNMPEFVQGFDVGLAMYQPENLYTHGIFSSPLKIFEYMSTGLIPICTTIEQTRSLIVNKHNGFLLPTSSPEALVQVLTHISSNLTELERCSIEKAARETVVAGFSWDRVSNDTISVLNNAIRSFKASRARRKATSSAQRQSIRS